MVLGGTWRFVGDIFNGIFQNIQKGLFSPEKQKSQPFRTGFDYKKNGTPIGI